MRRVICGILMLCAVSTVFGVEIIHYDNTPISINVLVGQERSIRLDDDIKVGLSPSFNNSNVARIQSAQGVVHILARDVFQERLQLRRLSDNQVILVDVVSEKPKKDEVLIEDIEIVMMDSKDTQVIPKSETPKAAALSPVEITRHMAQKLYGPSRLLKSNPAIQRRDIHDDSLRIFKGINGIRTVVKPIYAVRGGRFYGTALYIQNTSSNPIGLDYLDLHVSFDMATFQHHSLSPAGTSGDATVLYIITRNPFENGLSSWNTVDSIQSGDAS